jgi:hypothetical protein
MEITSTDSVLCTGKQEHGQKKQGWHQQPSDINTENRRKELTKKAGKVVYKTKLWPIYAI